MELQRDREGLEQRRYPISPLHADLPSIQTGELDHVSGRRRGGQNARPSQNRLYAVFVDATNTEEHAVLQCQPPTTSVCMPVPSGLATGSEDRVPRRHQGGPHDDRAERRFAMRLKTYDCGQVDRQWSQSFDCVFPDASTTGAKPPGRLISRSRPKDEPSSSSASTS